MRRVSLRQARRNDHTTGKIVTTYRKFVQGCLRGYPGGYLGYLSAQRRRAWERDSRKKEEPGHLSEKRRIGRAIATVTATFPVCSQENARPATATVTYCRL
jgi:hypothetical protein